MATVPEAVEELAKLTYDIKTKYRLSENTVLRIIDMQLAMTTFKVPEPMLPAANKTPDPASDKEAA